MSRVLLLAMGVPAFVAWPRHAGPGLRAAHLATALASDGHDVLVVAVLDESAAVPTTVATIPTVFTREKDLFGPAMVHRLRTFAPDAVVGVTVYAAALAARLRLDAPLWADVFGDLMAEAQAKAARTGDDWSVVHFWTLLRGVLDTADRFSAVSAAQAGALVGQLGMAGRLGAATAGEKLVAVIPCAAQVPSLRADREAARRELGIGADDFVLLASGGVNTWCDVDTLAAGVAAAMRENAGLRLVTTGGAIAGHDETSLARLARGLEAADRSRVHDLGWIDSSRLPSVYAASDLALHIEEDLYERELGAENRVIEWLAHGLGCATTALSETGRELVDAKLARPVRCGDAADLARTILAAAGDRDALAEAALRGAHWVATVRGLADTAAPLRRWCAAPQRAGDHGAARLVRVGLLSHPERSVELLEAYVATLPLRELARRGLRWIWRRATFARRPGPGAAVVLLAAAALGLPGCPNGAGPPATTRPDILLLTLETLRADRVGACTPVSSAPTPTPRIDRLASDGVVFEQAMASSPDTEAALGTLMTGVYQDRHGAMRAGDALAGSAPTLARRLKDAGYATAAFANASTLRATPGLEQGFDRVDLEPAASRPVAARDDTDAEAASDRSMASRSAAFLRGAVAGGPHFVWVHLRGADAVDERAGEVLAALSGASRPAIVAVVGVHGDGVGANVDPATPVRSLRDGALRVPWILAWSGGLDAATVRDPACGVDLVPTLLELAGVVASADDFDGRPLAGRFLARSAQGESDSRVLAGGHRPAAVSALREVGCFAVDSRANHPFALRTARYKMILTPGASVAGSASESAADADRIQVFDLFEDPGETLSIHVERGELVDDMLQPLAALRSRFRANGRRW